MCSTLSMMSGPFLQLPPPSELLDIFGKVGGTECLNGGSMVWAMVINTFTISNQELLDIGAGLYLSPSCLDHRCSPNAVGLFNGKTLMVEQYVFLSYVDQMAPSWERQEQLQKQYYFLCQCPRCLDSSLDKAMTAVTTDPSDQDCGVGSQAVKAKAMESTDIKLCLTAIEKINQLKKTEGSSQEVLTLYRDSLWKVRFSLPASNIYKVRLLDGAFDAAISNSIWEEALPYGLQTLKPYRQFLPPCSPQLGMQLLRLAKLRLWLQRDHAEAYAHLIEAEKMITLTHGKDSELYGQLRKLLSQAASHQDPW
ncbi:hypothetical protein ACOMHN_044563 [Nucella lapillus]